MQSTGFVKTRMIAFRFFKQFGMRFPPLAESLHRRDMANDFFEEYEVVNLKMPDQRPLQADWLIQSVSVEQPL